MTTHLYFDSLVVGEITAIESDFPLFNGEFQLIPHPEDETALRIAQYIDLCIRQDTYYSEALTAEQEEGSEAEDETALNPIAVGLAEEENKFLDLINSNSWKTVDEEGRSARILTPMFGINNSISWRLNFE
jgi:hypothetical protein